MIAPILIIQLAAACLAIGDSESGVEDDGVVTFAVLGHVRGDPNDGDTNYLLDELIADVNAQHPDAVILTGDMIYGDCHSTPADAKQVTREWELLDAALGKLNAPVYRVPGNHDIHDTVTRDIYAERYGKLPAYVDVGRCRLLLLNSCWVPSDDYIGPKRGVRGWQLDAEQIAFIEEALAHPNEFDHAFVFVHHLLWWKPDAMWWRQVHPILAKAGVRAVFSGEFGPYKYSHMRRDGVDYLQCAIENPPNVGHMRLRESSRILSQLMDCYILVRASAEDVDIEVRPVGALTSGNYSPQRWAEVYDYKPRYAVVFEKIMRRYPVVALGGVALFSIVLGVVLGRFINRKRAPTKSTS